MNNSSLITGGLIILGITGLFWWGAQNKAQSAQNTTQPSMLAAAQKFHNFGTISMKNGNVERVFEVKNPTGADINLTSVTTSCMCTTAYIVKDGARKGPFGMPGHGGLVPKANEIIRPGETLNISVVFNPNAHGPSGIGFIDRFVYLEDENGGVLELEIQASVTP